MNWRLLLCTDLDRTLIPNGSEIESPQARELFSRLASRDGLVLAYVTGRDLARVETAIKEYRLPEPQHIVADVGTTILDRRVNGDWSVNQEWQHEIARDWGEHGHAALARQLDSLSQLELQEPSKQGRLKLSYYTSTRVPADELLQRVRSCIAGLGLPATLVYSVDEPRNVGLLDVLPARASKLAAVRFVMAETGFSDAETLFCGDSGNDLSVLGSTIPGVLVANAAAKVRRQALELAEKEGNDAHIYVARGGFLGMNGNYAAGILEGVDHFYPAVGAMLRKDVLVGS